MSRILRTFVGGIAALAVVSPTAAAAKTFTVDVGPLQLNPGVVRPAGGDVLDPAAYANSGLPNLTKLTGTYLLRFARPGTYRLYCLVHRGMNVLVHVAPRSRPIRSPAQVQAVAQRQVRAALRLARRLAHFKEAPLTVLAGHDAGSVSWMRFFPEHLRVRIGQTVTFRVDSMMDAHTFTFGPEPYTSAIERTLIAYPNLPSVRITFTKPGTYHFECVIHPRSVLESFRQA